MGVNRKQFLLNEIVKVDPTKSTDDILNGDIEETYHSLVNAGTIPSTSSILTSKRRGLLPPDPGTSRFLSLPTVMATPPTVTMGAANAGSTIAGSALIPANDPNITYLGAGYSNAVNNSGYSYAQASAYITTTTGSMPAEGRMRIEIETDTDQLEFFFRAGYSTINYRIWVDGQLATALPVAASVGGGATYNLKVAFAGAANRRIIFEGIFINLIGINLHPTRTLWPTTRPVGPKVVWIGDSFTEGTGANWWWDSWAMVAGRWLGWNVIPSGVGSTGYLTAGQGGGKVKFRDRIAADVMPLNPDIIVISGGYNDTSSYSATQMGNEADLLYAGLKSNNPSASLVVCSVQSPVGISSTGIITQFRDAQKASALKAGALFVDTINYPNGNSWVTGSGSTSAPAGNGNADFYDWTDGVHPSQAGHDYMGRRFASYVSSKL